MDSPLGHTISLSSFSLQMSRLTDNFNLEELLKPQDPEEARRKWGEYLNFYYPSNVICLQVDGVDDDDVVEDDFDNLDDFDVDGGEWPLERHTVAHELYDQFQEVMRMCEDGGERKRINTNYNLAQAIVTPIHRLPDDLLSEIFVFVIDHFYQERTSLRAVCRQWDTLLTLLPIFSSTLELHKWSDKNDVEAFLERGKTVPSTVTIFTRDDVPPLSNDGQPYEALELAIKSIERWCYLTFQGPDTRKLHLLLPPCSSIFQKLQLLQRVSLAYSSMMRALSPFYHSPFILLFSLVSHTYLSVAQVTMNPWISFHISLLLKNYD